MQCISYFLGHWNLEKLFNKVCVVYLKQRFYFVILIESKLNFAISTCKLKLSKIEVAIFQNFKMKIDHLKMIL